MSRVALITGGSCGIGAACVREFLARHWSVAVVALQDEDLANLSGLELTTVEGDIRDERIRRKAVCTTLSRFGRIDILVNNAGIGLYAFPSEVNIELAQEAFAVNFFAAVALTQLVVPVMRHQKSGTIVNLGSVAGAVSLPWASMYSASKFAFHAFSDALRRELMRSNIHVMKVCPGIVDTDFRNRTLRGTPPPGVLAMRPMVSAEDVAQSIVRGIERRSRTVYMPWVSRPFAAIDLLAPRLMDWYLARKSSRAR